MTTNATDRLLTPADLAERLGVHERQLGQMRYQGTGPRFVKLAHKVVRYRESDVDAWIESRVRQQTGQVA